MCTHVCILKDISRHADAWNKASLNTSHSQEHGLSMRDKFKPHQTFKCEEHGAQTLPLCSIQWNRKLFLFYSIFTLIFTQFARHYITYTYHNIATPMNACEGDKTLHFAVSFKVGSIISVWWPTTHTLPLPLPRTFCMAVLIKAQWVMEDSPINMSLGPPMLRACCEKDTE